MSDDIVREFLVESSENLDLLDRELINLEKDPATAARSPVFSARSTRSRAPADFRVH